MGIDSRTGAKPVKKRRVALVVGLVSAVAAFGLTACGAGSSPSGPVDGPWADVVAAANKEGKVTIYSTQAEPRLGALEAAFEAKYPQIDMQVVRGVDADILSKIDAEVRSGKGIGDVAVTTDVSWIQANSDNDAAVKLVGPAFDEPAYNRATTVVDDRFFLEGAVVLGLGWNTQAIPQGVKKPQDLLDPALKGKIGIVSPGTSTTYLDYYAHLEKYYGGRDFLKKIAAQKPRIYPSSQPLGQAVASGEISAGLMTDPMLPSKEAGAPVEWTAGEHVWGAKWNGMALGSSPNPNAAQVLADFMVTPEGQATTSVGYAAALPDIEGSIENAQGIGDQNLDVTVGADGQKYRNELEQLFTSGR
ncbi:extracellular solute-binding protein [Gordonia sp. HY002]|uniref:extracellular solute-binding protein n=1 Tax=Gordonia zhenghanii TaxID=2911516 RepID=UPI001EF1088B|nr:extracellular solute-binding protein [Gordonia zhenghanii]MCF8571895.1 extracellular solute-binding protein [Gordonia zhenghanii]MCF8605921.1 extracellular solute-binding protein [Gordonia zhenghanii]